MKTLLQAIDLGVANICSIEEGEQVKDTKLPPVRCGYHWESVYLPMELDTGRVSKQVFCPDTLLGKL